MTEIERIIKEYGVFSINPDYSMEQVAKAIEQYVQEEIRKAVEMEANCHGRD